MGLASLGSSVIRTLILPHVQQYLRLLEPEMNNAKNAVKRSEALHCFAALLQAVGEYVKCEYKSGRLSVSLPAASSGSNAMETEGSDSGEGESRKKVKGLDAHLCDIPISYSDVYTLFGEAILPYIQFEHNHLPSLENYFL